MSVVGRLRGSIPSNLWQSMRKLRRALKDTTEEFARLPQTKRLRRLAEGRTDLKLNVGCGARVIDGWLNLDAHPASAEVIYYNAFNPLPIADNSVKRIHSEHFLEHMEYEDALALLVDCHRVLACDGTMRIIVPDSEKYMAAYAASDVAFCGQLKFLGNPPSALETNNIICNQMFRMGGDHRFAWDFETLELACRKAGFGTIEKSSWKSGPAEFQIDGLDEWRPIESLYCEIWK